MNPEPLSKPEPPALFFPWGLPGLERYRRFTVVPVPDNRFFLLLQSEDEPAIGMLLLDPFPLFPSYRCTLTDSDRQDLALERREDLLVYTTVSVSPEGLCTNLAAPLAINTASRLGKQLYLRHYGDRLRVPLVHPSSRAPGKNPAATGGRSIFNHKPD